MHRTISRKLCRFLFMFSTGFTSLSVVLLFPLLITFFLYAQFLILFYLTLMRFSQSTHLLMCLSLEAFMSITRTGLPILVELINLVNYVIISNELTLMVNSPTQIPDCDSHSLVLLDLFISSDASICSTMAFP